MRGGSALGRKNRSGGANSVAAVENVAGSAAYQLGWRHTAIKLYRRKSMKIIWRQ